MLSLKTDLRSFNDLDKTLQKLGEKITRNASAVALRAAGRVIVKNAKSRLPSHYGSLKKSLGSKVLKARDPYNRIAIVGPRTSGSFEGWYGHIVEYGTLASRTEPLAPKTRRKAHTSPLPQGLTSIPFLRPAIDTTKKEQLRAMAKKMEEYLKKRGYR